MIQLKKQENIEIYECLLSLKEQDKQNPLIAVLLLAKELDGNITPEILQKELFPIFPLKYCESILDAFYKEEYLTYKEFKLTQKGIEATEEKILWKEKTGIYNVISNNSSLLKSNIIKLKLLDKKEFNKEATNNLSNTLEILRNYPIENGTKEISEIISGFKKETKTVSLNAIISNNDINYKIEEYKFEEIQQLKNENELEILCRFLKENKIYYKIINNEIRIIAKFDESNLSFKRKVTIKNPTIKLTTFNDFELELHHIPIDKENAQKWYEAILVNELKDYFTDNQSFMAFSISKTEQFENQFKLKVPSRKTVIELLKNTENNFYKIAKLETINYLNY